MKLVRIRFAEFQSCPVLLGIALALCLYEVSSATNEIDRLSLLAFKAGITKDPFGVLDSWNHSIGFCQWYGVTCGRRHPRVTVLDLSSRGLSGPISPHIGNLSFLRELRLQNNSLDHEIPSQVGQLHQLRILQLNNNSLVGEIPRNISGCSDLVLLNLGLNKLSRNIPGELGSFPKLRYFGLFGNNLTGGVPSSIGNLSSLEILHLAINNLGGSIPQTLGHLANLRVMKFAENRLSGTIPSSLLNLSSLTAFDVQSNRIQGTLPIPPPTTVFYSIANNKISGEISHLICNATTLVVLDLSNNSLMGTLPECLMSFSKDLSVLNLRMNMIQGVIPGKIARNSNLRTLDFSQNRFEGTLPRSLLQCKNLKVLDLSNNRMEDTFPDWLEKLPMLQVLVLRSNMFHGFVRSPRAARPFSELRIFDLSKNNLSGPLPVGYIMKLTAMMNRDKGRGKLQYMGGYGYQDSVMVTMKGLEIRLVKILTVFTSIDLSSNHFGGELPVDIGSLKSLKGLNFSHNNLTGYIPLSTGNLTDLEWLDLSSNQFIGRIPRELADLTSLAFLNLSENRLIGPIPLGPQFNTFKSDSFAGNPGLCGFPLPETCENSSRETPPVTILQENDTEHGGWFEWRAMLMGYGSGIVAGISLGYIVIDSRKLEWLVGLFGGKGAKMRRKSRRNARRSYQR